MQLDELLSHYIYYFRLKADILLRSFTITLFGLFLIAASTQTITILTYDYRWTSPYFVTQGYAHLGFWKRPELTAAWHPFFSSSPSFSAHSSASILSLQGDSPLSGHPKTLRDLTTASEILVLPASFGSIQLGETFSSCLCLNNETQVDIEVTQVRVEMQTVTSKLLLFEMDAPGKSIHGGDALEFVVYHETKELGQHALACAVTYLPKNARGTVENASLQTFRKFYKFAVTNPFSVKTKVHSARSPTALLSPSQRDVLFLEIHIQNLTQDAIYFERMRLECTDEWESIDGNMLPSDAKHQTGIFSANMALMQPQDMRQYVYILTPKVSDLVPSAHAPGSIIPLGRLDIVWRSHYGEPGRLLTSVLSRRIPLPPARPASAVPPSLKKNIGGPTPPRLQVGLQPQSRPGTPVPGQPPGSPVAERSSFGTEGPPILSRPDIEVQLLVRHIPSDGILVEKPFSVAFSIVIWSTIHPNQDHIRRKYTLAVQHMQRRRRVSPPSVTQGWETQRLPTSGASTQAAGRGAFDYVHARQKIVEASSRPLLLNTVADSHDQDGNKVFPLPFFEGNEEDPLTNVASFLGSSVVFLPPFEIDHAADKPTQVRIIRDFELMFASLRKGFTVVKGLRILMVDNRLVQDSEDLEHRVDERRKVEILREYETVAEVWVAS